MKKAVQLFAMYFLSSTAFAHHADYMATSWLHELWHAVTILDMVIVAIAMVMACLIVLKKE